MQRQLWECKKCTETEKPQDKGNIIQHVMKANENKNTQTHIKILTINAQQQEDINTRLKT